MKIKLKLKHLIIFTILISLYSCSDGDNSLKIKAEVLEYETLKPIVDAKVYIFGGESKGGLNGSTFFLVDSVMTDEQGGFIWDSEGAISASFYSIKAVRAEGYFNLNEEVLIFGNSTEGATRQIILDPHSWLHLNVIDDPSIPGDYHVTVATFILPNTLSEFEEIYFLRGNRYIYIKTKTGIGESLKKDSFYLPALDTLYHEIRF